MKKKLLIEGMSCMHCVKHVKDALSELKGVTSVEVNLEAKYAIVEVDGTKDEELRVAVEETGYDVTGITQI